MKKKLAITLSTLVFLSPMTTFADKYTVKQGDNLWDISEEQRVDFYELLDVNSQIPNKDLIFPEQIIQLPKTSSIYYTVLPGDSLWRIAIKLNINFEKLLNANPEITNKNLIYPGQKIKIPERRDGELLEQDDSNIIKPQANTDKVSKPKVEEQDRSKPKKEKPEATEPEEEKPEVTEPKEEKPEATEPEEEKPEVTEPKEEKPEATEPEEEKPEVTEPKEEKPEATEPEEEKPEVTEPKEEKPEATEPEEEKPEVTEPEEEKPEATEPEEEKPGVTDPEEENDGNASTGNHEQYMNEVVSLVNVERANNGLPALKLNGDVSKVAYLKAKDMADNNYFSHTSPTYGTPFEMLTANGVTYLTAGENIAKGYTSPKAVVQGWMNSEGHRANILNGNFTEIGIGYESNGHNWVQMFIGK
ncbi:LysM peptidoglycan-binding domain-containing protein [Cytobacillus kochii]|uniref:LysM peptidoglycan-binding domain-containing protein n=1 Tax=Cytobacillus kochii TaxID=859143 RepID=UPI003851099A